MNTIIKEKFDTFVIFLILFLPVALITGPFLSDLSIVLLSVLFLFNYRYQNIPIDTFKYLIFFLIFSLILISSSLLSQFKVHSLESSLFYFRFIIFAYALSYFFLKIKTLPNKLYYILLVTLIFISLDAIYQYFFGINFFGFENKYPWTPAYGQGEYHRVSGVFRDELKLGSYISKVLPILISLFFFLKINSKINLFFLITAIVLSIVTILITSERLALVNTIIFIIICFVLLEINKRYKIFFLIISAILIFTFLFFDKNLNKRIYTIFDSFNSSEYIFKNFNKIEDDIPENISIFTNQHAKHYITALRLFNDNYLLGIGPKNFRKLCDKEPYKLKYSCSTHPHNTYIQLLSETGIVGFVFIICLFFYHSLILIKLFINKYIYNNQNINSITCVNILIFINLWPIAPSGSFYNNWNSIIFYLPFGILLFYKAYEKNNK